MSSKPPFNPTINRTQQIVEHLTDQIVTGTIARNTTLLAEREMAESLGVSRTVVREATRVLQSRGLVIIRQGVGTLVTGVTSVPMEQVISQAIYGQKDALTKMTAVRVVLECEVARLAAQHATAEDVASLRELLAGMEVELEQPERFAELDGEFHLALAQVARNELFVLTLEPFANLIRQSREFTLSFVTTQLPHAAHTEIVDAIERGDGEAAAHLMREHIVNATLPLGEL